MTRMLPLDSASTALEKIIGASLPLWLEAVIHAVWVSASSGVAFVVYLRFVRPAVYRMCLDALKAQQADWDDIQLQSYRRRRTDYEKDVREMLASDFERATQHEQTARHAMDMARAATTAVEAQSTVIHGLAGQSAQNLSAIGAVAEMLQSLTQDVRDFKKDFNDWRRSSNDNR